MTILTVLSAGAIRRSVAKVAQLFERATGNRVSTEFAPAPQVRSRLLAGEIVDVVIASAGALDALAKESKIAVQTRAVVGRTGMAVMMRRGASAPDLSSAEAFRQAMLEADALVYNEGSSGAHAAKIVDRLGLREAMGSRIRVAKRGADLVEAVATGSGRVLGLAQLTSVLDQADKGEAVALAGLFPDEIQNVTSYEIAVSAASLEPKLAGDLVRAFATPEVKQLLAAAGLD